MRLSDLRFSFYGIHRYLSGEAADAAPRLSSEKSQYVYRAICVTDGQLRIVLDGTPEDCKPGDVIFLVPGSRYRLIPGPSGFGIWNLFFDLLPADAPPNPMCHRHCVFWEHFEPAACPAPLVLEDAPILSHSCVFHRVSCAGIFSALHLAKQDSPHFSLYTGAKLTELLCLLLDAPESPADAAAEQIISYIRLHPNRQLSAADLEQRFGYHRNYINALVKRRTGSSLSRFIRKIKIEYAVTLLSSGISPTQAARELGYYDYSHFYKAFLAQTGHAPSGIK